MVCALVLLHVPGVGQFFGILLLTNKNDEKSPVFWPSFHSYPVSTFRDGSPWSHQETEADEFQVHYWFINL